MDWLIEKATELGAEKIVPTIFKRTLIKLKDNATEKTERWKRGRDRGMSHHPGRFIIPEIVTTPLRGITDLIKDVGKHVVLCQRKGIQLLRMC